GESASGGPRGAVAGVVDRAGPFDFEFGAAVAFAGPFVGRGFLGAGEGRRFDACAIFSVKTWLTIYAVFARSAWGAVFAVSAWQTLSPGSASRALWPLWAPWASLAFAG